MPIMTVTKWRALSLKRLAYLDELKRTGRWQQSFSSEAAFEDVLRAAGEDAERWKQLAYFSDRPVSEAAE